MTKLTVFAFFQLSLLTYLIWNQVSAKPRVIRDVAEDAELFERVFGAPKNDDEDREAEAESVPSGCSVALNFSHLRIGPILHPRFVASPHVTRLTLRNASLQSFSLGAFADLPNLEQLDASWNNLSVQTMFSFGSHPSLRELVLSDNRRDDDSADERQYSPYSIEYYTSTPKPPIEPLRHEYPRLRQLHLRNVSSYPAFGNWSQSFPRLELLDIAGNDFVVDQDRIFADLPRTLRTLTARRAGLHRVDLRDLLSLRELDLDGNVFEDVCDKYCAEFVRNNRLKIENLPSLEKLILSNCYIRTLHSNAFSDLAKLSALDLSSNSILEVPDTLFDRTPSLKFLNLSHNSLASIDFLRDRTSLEILILADMKDRAPISSDVLRTLGNLKVLSLSNNALSEVPARFLNNLPELRELDLSHNQLSALPYWENFEKLERLNLRNNKFVAIDDLPVARAFNLKLLIVGQNPLGSIKSRSLINLPDDSFISLL
ncbi:protein artichoke-like [Trichogramma pretiosum]|uniref:protein artichoke-like n=1 Tax=Trichogramma pretiosum TaxID=7493 RepID=UPI0006C95529|nr:protein artichoke-like [Trichogramma pretiosum]